MVKLLSLLLDLSPLAQENRVIALHTANLFHGKGRSPHSKAMPNPPQHKAANCWCNAPSYGCAFTNNATGPGDVKSTIDLRAKIAATTPACPARSR